MKKKTTKEGPVTMERIEARVRSYAAACDEAFYHARSLDMALKTVLAKRIESIRQAVREMETRKAELEAELERAPELFTRPKSRVIHGIKFGYKKLKGKLDFADPDAVVKKIHRLFPELAETLIKTTETPQKDALDNLKVSDLKKLGVTVIEDDNVPFIKLDDTDGEKLIKSLMNGNGGE